MVFCRQAHEICCMEFDWSATMPFSGNLADWLARLRAMLAPPHNWDDYAGDPLAHPDLREMSLRELADLPFPRLQASDAREQAHRRGKPAAASGMTGLAGISAPFGRKGSSALPCR